VTETSTGAGRHLSDVRLFDFDLPDEVRWGLVEAGFVFATPIQARTLPLTLAGKDVAGQAQTGTGKTAAFLMTIFSRLLRERRPGPARGPRALVIAPTRELVVEIGHRKGIDAFTEAHRYLSPRTAFAARYFSRLIAGGAVSLGFG